MRKLLSLTLALVMTVSLVTFGMPTASAASFTDNDSIRYGEAVDVISALNIVGGYSDGTFRPTGYLTRGAAAKIICNMMLTPAIADAMPRTGTSFSDVPSGSTFAGYVTWCVQHNIVSGYSDGTFKPSDKLSGFAFLKMLLGALGYDQNIEHYTGSGWSINVQNQALTIGLGNGLEGALAGGEGVTREVACLFAFNTLQADEVEYTGSTAATRRERTWTTNSRNAGNINSETRNGENIVQFAEDKFPALVRNGSGFSGSDAFARPATRWTQNGNSVGTYASEPVRTYYGDVTLGTIYSDLGLSRSTSDVKLFLNGVEETKTNDSGETVPVLTLSSGSSARLSSVSSNAGAAIGNGTQIQTFKNDLDNSITICVVTYYGGKIDSVQPATASAERYVVIQSASGAGKAPATITSGSNNRFKTTDFAKDDVVAYTYSEKAGETQRIQSLQKLTAVEGAPSQITANTSLDMNGRTYYYARKVAFEGGLNGSETNLKTGNDYTLYLLNLGGNDTVLWIEDVKVAVAEAYALLTAFQNGTSFASAQARLVFADGKENSVNANRNSDAFTNKDDRTDDPELVRYSVNSDGSYTLKKLSGTESAVSANAAIRNRTAYGLNGTADSTDIPADDNTIFVIAGTNGFTAYTGIRNVPNVSGDSVKAYTYYQDGTARVVFITNATTSTTSRDLMFVAANSASPVITDSTTTNGYRNFAAVIGNRIRTIKVEVGSTLGTLTVSGDSSFAPKAQDSVIVNNTTTNANGAYIAGSFSAGNVSADSAQGFSAPSGGVIRVGTNGGATGTRLTLADGVNVFSVDADGAISGISLSAVTASADDWAFYTVEDNEITNLFILKG